MKALEYLKKEKLEIESIDLSAVKIKYVNEIIKELDNVNEAIKEVEAMQERIKELETPKTCDGCKYDAKEMSKECYMCSRNVNDLYEPKDNQ